MKDKWFIDVTEEDKFPPQTRYNGALARPYTDGNHLEPHIDGAALMAEFHDQLEMLINAEDPSQWTLHISAMNIHPVKLLGEQNPAIDAMTRILALLLVGMLIGSVIVSLAPMQEIQFLDFIPYDVFILVFIIAAVLALGYILFAIWSAWRDHQR